jgi:hypothetical protein
MTVVPTQSASSVPSPAQAETASDPVPAVTPASTAVDELSAVPVATGKPKRPLLISPLIRDWTFWLFVVVAAIGGTQSLYRTGRSYSNASASMVVSAGGMDVLISLVGGAVVFCLLPATIRKVVHLRKDRKAWASRPSDDSAGWKPDPAHIAEQRWWSGSAWTNATLPEKKPGRGYLWVLLGLAVLTVVVFMAGLGSGPANGQSPTRDDGLSSNAALAVGASFNGLATSLQDYGKIPIDPNAPFTNIMEVKSAFEKVETNYLELKGALPAITSQAELGAQAPDLQKLKAFVAAMGPYVEARKAYYTALEACGPLNSGRAPTDCDVNAFDAAEKSMVDSIQPVATTWEAVIASIPKASG